MNQTMKTACVFVFHIFVLNSAALPTHIAMAADDILIADVKKDAMPAGWQVEGYAFGSREPGSERQRAKRKRPAIMP